MAKTAAAPAAPAPAAEPPVQIVQRSAPPPTDAAPSTVPVPSQVAQQSAKDAPPVPAEGKPKAEDAGLTIEELVKLQLEDPALTGEHKGVDYQKVLASLPEDAKKLVANLRADFTRKTQAVAEERKQIEAQRRALFDSEAYKMLRQMAEKEAGEFDPYNPDSFVDRIKQEVAKQLLETYKPVAERMELQAHQAKLEAFQAEHPELRQDVDFRKSVAAELKANDNLNLEQAYWIVKGRRTVEEQQTQQKELAAYRDAARAAGLRVSTGQKGGERKPPPTLKTGAEIARWLQSQQGT